MHLEISERREPGCSLLLLTGIMIREEQIETIKEFLLPFLVDDLFLVDIRIKPTNNIKIFIDADSGLSIDKCSRINRALYRAIEEAGLYPDGNFSLEVSSPGVTEPLKLQRQYLKNIGRELEVVKEDGTTVTGKLTEASELKVVLEYTEGKNKKAVLHQVEIPFEEIKKATVQVKF